jgi:hypothetical protein
MRRIYYGAGVRGMADAICLAWFGEGFFSVFNVLRIYMVFMVFDELGWMVFGWPKG